MTAVAASPLGGGAGLRGHQLPLAGLLAGALVAGTLAPVGVLVVSLGLAVLVGVIVRPHATLVAYLFLVPFHVVVALVLEKRYGAHLGPLVDWKEAVPLALLLRGIHDRGREHGWRLPADPTTRLVIGWVLVSLLVAALSPEPTAAGIGLVHSVEGPVVLLAILALRPPRRTLVAGAVALLAGACVMGIAALVEQAVGPAFVTALGGSIETGASRFYGAGGAGYRSSAFLVTPLELAFYGAAVLPLAVASLAAGGSRRLRLVATAAVPLAGAALLATFTRSGYAGALVGVLLALGLAIRPPRVRVAALGLVVAAVALVGAVAVDGSVAGLDHGAAGTEAHLVRIDNDLGLVSANPLGYGLGSVDSVAQRINASAADDPGASAQEAAAQVAASASENIYLAKAVQGGVPLFILYPLLLFGTGMRLRQERLRAAARDDATARALAAAALGGLVAVAIAGLTLGVEELDFTAVLWGEVGIAFAMGMAPGVRRLP